MSFKPLAGLLGLALCAAAPALIAAAPAAPQGNVAAGRQAYADKGCASCHGLSGEGSPAGAAVAGTALDWSAYHGQLRRPRGTMPAYDARVLTDQEAADIYAYLKSLAAPKGAAGAAAVAQLKGDPVAGRKTYLENGCHACHGSVGQGGGPGPTLAATSMTLPAYHQQLRKPRSVMPAYGPTLMTDQEVADTWAYVKGLPGPRDPDKLPALLRAPSR
jgi:mono/diheme cytochrome c family protein